MHHALHPDSVNAEPAAKPVTASVEAGSNAPPSPLVERLDASIGEMSTVMGGMMSELLRRALRGSIRQIDEELLGQAAHTVDRAVAERLPEIERSAAEAADKVAREAATEVAVEEVHALEERARETERALAERIESAARMAEQHNVQTAQVLSGKIELAEQKADLAISSKTQELSGRIEEKALVLNDRIDATARSAATLTEEKAALLSRTIEEAERRANEAAQAEMARQVDVLLQSSKRATGKLKDRMQALETTAGTLNEQLIAEASDRQAGHADAARRVQAVVEQLEELRQRNDALAARITELEKPRGLRALWAWLFGRRKPAVD